MTMYAVNRIRLWASFVIMLIGLMLHPTRVQGQLVPEIDQPLAEITAGNSIYKLDWNYDGQTLAAATSDGLILYDKSLEVVTQLHAGDLIYSVSWHPNGTQLAVTNGNNLEIWQWDGSTLSLITSLQGDNPQIHVLWSPDGSQIATVEGLKLVEYWVGTIKFWSAATWELVATASGKYEFVESLTTVNQSLGSQTASPKSLWLALRSI